MMEEMIRMSPGLPRSGYSANVEVNDMALQTFSADEIKTECNKRRKNNNPVRVSLSINNVFCLETYYELLKKLEVAIGENVKLDIYASGEGFNTLMDAISYSSIKDKIIVHIDDYDVRRYIDLGCIDLTKTSCKCKFSRKYIRNFEQKDFNKICMDDRFIFDRNKAMEERKIISEVWRTIGVDDKLVNRLSGIAKTILITDYINNNISYAHDGHRIIGTHNGINQHYVEEWAKDGVLTYKRKSGVCSGQAELAEILLNNYYAKTNCFMVSGVYRPLRDKHMWIALKEQDQSYGICLTMRRRFVDLNKFGYEDHEVTLEYEHHNRNDYKYNIDRYAEFSDEKCKSLRMRVYQILAGDETPLPPRRLPRPLPKRKIKETPLPPRRLPKRVNNIENK